VATSHGEGHNRQIEHGKRCKTKAAGLTQAERPYMGPGMESKMAKIKFRRCPKCKSAHIIWHEKHIAVAEHEQLEDGTLDEDGVPSPGHWPGEVWGVCQKCEYIWKPRGIDQIIYLPNHSWEIEVCS